MLPLMAVCLQVVADRMHSTNATSLCELCDDNRFRYEKGIYLL